MKLVTINNKKLYFFISFIIVIIGTFLRFNKLNSKPFWIDEILFINFVNGDLYQEFVPVLIARLFNLQGEFWIRFLFAFAGSLTIAVICLILPQTKNTLIAMVIIAICPLFIYWSQLARPYAFAGLFVILGWRWWFAYIIGILTTPFAILGINLFKIKQRWYIYLGLFILASIMFKIRPDTDRNFFNLWFLTNAKRLWYIPLLSLVVHFAYFLDRSKRIFKFFGLEKQAAM